MRQSTRIPVSVFHMSYTRQSEVSFKELAFLEDLERVLGDFVFWVFLTVRGFAKIQSAASALLLLFSPLDRGSSALSIFGPSR